MTENELEPPIERLDAGIDFEERFDPIALANEWAIERMCATHADTIVAVVAFVLEHLATLDRTDALGLQNVATVRALILQRIARIDAAWRTQVIAVRNAPLSERLVSIVCANAECGLAWITADPDVERFLGAGVLDPHPAIRRSCLALLLVHAVPSAWSMTSAASTETV